MKIQYVVAECQPCEEEGYADIVINDQAYFFKCVEPAEDINAAMLITIDIERSNSSHKAIVLHHESILKLCHGIEGKTLQIES